MQKIEQGRGTHYVRIVVDDHPTRIRRVVDSIDDTSFGHEPPDQPVAFQLSEPLPETNLESFQVSQAVTAHRGILPRRSHGRRAGFARPESLGSPPNSSENSINRRFIAHAPRFVLL
jgi:hypothetical protein